MVDKCRRRRSRIPSWSGRGGGTPSRQARTLGHTPRTCCQTMRSKLHLAAQLHYPMLRYDSLTHVPDSMTVRANEVALGRFLHQTGQTSAELAEAKLLCRWIAMM